MNPWLFWIGWIVIFIASFFVLEALRRLYYGYFGGMQ